MILFCDDPMTKAGPGDQVSLSSEIIMVTDGREAVSAGPDAGACISEESINRFSSHFLRLTKH
jgi:hypothetical protein